MMLAPAPGFMFAPAPAPSPMLAATGTIPGTMILQGISLNSLQANPTLEAAFKGTCQITIAKAANADPSHVVVTLSEGSVRVDYVITVPAGTLEESSEDLRH